MKVYNSPYLHLSRETDVNWHRRVFGPSDEYFGYTKKLSTKDNADLEKQVLDSSKILEQVFQAYDSDKCRSLYDAFNLAIGRTFLRDFKVQKPFPQSLGGFTLLIRKINDSVSEDLWLTKHKGTLDNFFNYLTTHANGFVTEVDNSLKAYPSLKQGLKYLKDNEPSAFLKVLELSLAALTKRQLQLKFGADSSNGGAEQYYGLVVSLKKPVSASKENPADVQDLKTFLEHQLNSFANSIKVLLKKFEYLEEPEKSFFAYAKLLGFLKEKHDNTIWKEHLSQTLDDFYNSLDPDFIKNTNGLLKNSHYSEWKKGLAHLKDTNPRVFFESVIDGLSKLQNIQDFTQDAG